MPKHVAISKSEDRSLYMISKLQNKSTPDRIKLTELIQEQQNIKKSFEIQDAYKLIYQSVFGPGHIIVNPAMAKNYLAQEFKSISGSNNETLIENISVTGEIVRLNLRTYKYRNGNIDKLFQAMLRSATEISGNNEDFLALWNEFKQAVFGGELNFNKEELQIFDQKVKSESYPARHHSVAYKEANQPAYRVLKSCIAKQLL